MMKISRFYTLQAAHRLPRVPEGHKCGRLHGHTYRVKVTLEGELDSDDGWFADFADIDAVYQTLVHARIDHTYLNDTIENPTTENMCLWMIAVLRPAIPLLHSVSIAENDHSLVECPA
jgi:6-pyruvoyltetrahydropterin/6-carboxytetrahydropterin synthase